MSLIMQDSLKEIQALYLKLEDVYWCFNDMDGPDEDDDTKAGQLYMSIHEKMDEILSNASRFF